jgi:probable rRNA maturation factor
MININNLNKDKVSIKKLEKIGQFVLEKYKKNNYSVSVAFVSKNRIKELNRDYRGLDKITDVLSFSATKEEKINSYLGEIVISCYQIKKQAKELKNSFQYELIFIFVHGLLHLLGYNDEDDKSREVIIKLGEKLILEYNEIFKIKK